MNPGRGAASFDAGPTTRLREGLLVFAGAGGPAGSAPPPAAGPVLPTLGADGARRWLRPRPARGRYLRLRQALGAFLVLLYLVLPHLRLGGRPALLIDLPARELTLLGAVFRPSDVPLLMVALLGLGAAVLLVTAVFGRVWCGWACPQTVYLELVFRPLERLVEGRGRGAGVPAPAGRVALKHAAYVVLAVGLANTFLAYFVGTDQLAAWMFGSPLEHPTAFTVMAGMSALVYLDFAWFREQTCLIACPYGRLQAALVDRTSLVVGYDRARGEPRGKRGRAELRERRQGEAEGGDCIDCGACARACPMGIDIRDGLQMECTGCLQCVDACDDVMTRLGREPGLVGYRREVDTRAALLRPRVIGYGLGLLAAVVALVLGVVRREPARLAVLRASGAPFVLVGGEHDRDHGDDDDGDDDDERGVVENRVRLRVQNLRDAPRRYVVRVEATGPVSLSPCDVVAAGGAVTVVEAAVRAPRSAFEGGSLPVVFVFEDGEGHEGRVPFPLVGPR